MWKKTSSFYVLERNYIKDTVFCEEYRNLSTVLFEGFLYFTLFYVWAIRVIAKNWLNGV